jgi:hypothetical protein
MSLRLSAMIAGLLLPLHAALAQPASSPAPVTPRTPVRADVINIACDIEGEKKCLERCATHNPADPKRTACFKVCIDNSGCIKRE